MDGLGDTETRPTKDCRVVSMLERRGFAVKTSVLFQPPGVSARVFSKCGIGVHLSRCKHGHRLSRFSIDTIQPLRSNLPCSSSERCFPPRHDHSSRGWICKPHDDQPSDSDERCPAAIFDAGAQSTLRRLLPRQRDHRRREYRIPDAPVA